MKIYRPLPQQNIVFGEKNNLSLGKSSDQFHKKRMTEIVRKSDIRNKEQLKRLLSGGLANQVIMENATYYGPSKSPVTPRLGAKLPQRIGVRTRKLKLSMDPSAV